MKLGIVRCAALYIGLGGTVCNAQTMLPELKPISSLLFPTGPLTISQPAVPNRPFTVAGAGGAILGMQDGAVELWQFPLKFFSNLQIRAEVDGYPVPINLNSDAATVEVSPDHTTLIYAHAAIVAKQHMFVPGGDVNKGLGGVIVFVVESIASATATISVMRSTIL